MSWVYAWAKAFALTVAVESGVAVPLLGHGQTLGRRALAALLAQLLTHPVVWFVLPELRLGFTLYLLLAETWAVVLELIFYRLVFGGLSWRYALGVSALANGASFAVGLLVL